MNPPRERTRTQHSRPSPLDKVGAVHYVIMGCGRVGSSLARTLEAAGHTVAIVDRDESAFRRLPSTFLGRRVVGVGFDRETLVAAGIEHAHAFAAVSSGDNSNILSARVARETYGVEHVVARIYDPGRAEIYERLGIPTVATVRWTADQVLRRIVPQEGITVHHDQTGTVSIVEMPVAVSWVGRSYEDMERATGARIAYVTRLNTGVLPRPGLVHQEGDTVYVVTETARRAEVEAVLGEGPGHGGVTHPPIEQH